MLATILQAILILLALGVMAVVAWTRRMYAAGPDARAGLASSAEVEVRRSKWLVFEPRHARATTGVVFYPGGKADPVAYAPILRALAQRGILVVLVPMPLNLAVLAPERAGAVLAQFPGIRRWFIAGHSLGGAIACQFAHRHSDHLAGLLLWAAYPGKETDLASSTLPMLSITASADRLTTPASVVEAAARLPSQARTTELADADHWTFGHFAEPDCVSGAARDALQARIVALSGDFLTTAGRDRPDRHRS